MSKINVLFAFCLKVKVKAKDLRGKRKDDLEKQLGELKLVSHSISIILSITFCRQFSCSPYVFFGRISLLLTLVDV